MELQPNTLLKGGTYRIIDILGKGGFGITYLAEHTHMGRKVCIKEFFPTTFYRRDEVSQTATIKDEDNTVMCERFKQKFLKEARTISTLDNPHIVRVFDSFEEHGTAYYVMEYIEGESLQSLVSRKGALDEAAARRYISQVADALAYIHERNTLHLDIKPSNIMVRKSDGRAILIDFGLAKHYDEDSGSQTTTTIGGHSDGYAPIEQYDTGGIQMFSPETDIYSLGATLYFLVTGERPPRARVVGNQGLPAMPSKLSTSLRTAVESAMQFSIKQRPHSVTEFITTLDGGRDTKRKSRWWLWILLLLLIAVGGVVGYMMSGGDNPEPTPTSSTGGEKVDNADSLRARERQDSLRAIERQDSLRERECQDSLRERERQDSLRARERQDSLRRVKELEQRRLDSLRRVDRERFVRDSIRERRRLDSLNRVDAASLRLNSSSVDVSYDGGLNSVSYRLENSLDYLKVECTTNKSWITDIKSSNNKISFTVKANSEHKSRSGLITVDYGTKSYSITVTQAARPAPTFTLAKSSLTVDSSGGSHSVGYTIEHPIDGASVSVSDNQSWITNLSASGGNITFKTTDNTSTESHTGTITATYNGITRQITVTQKCAEQITSTASSTININGHTAVDLGLSVKWATCNVGATSPEDYGNYYAWGETTTKRRYTEGNCKTYGKSMGDIGGDSRYDAATANWGSGWRLPTASECDELVYKCTWTWTTRNGVKGYEVKSKKNGNSIFLPAAGFCRGATPDYQGSGGHYWSSTPRGTYYAFRLYFHSGNHLTDWVYRGLGGLSVRPVAE